MKTVVIGGGIAGLTAARARQRAGVETLLLERGPEPGGVIRTVRRDGFLLETGPNTVRPTQELLEIVAELALGSELLVSDPSSPATSTSAGGCTRCPRRRSLSSRRVSSPSPESSESSPSRFAEAPRLPTKACGISSPGGSGPKSLSGSWRRSFRGSSQATRAACLPPTPFRR